MRPAAQRKAVEHAWQLFGISERRACTIFGVDRTSVRYAPRRGDDGDLGSWLHEIAGERRRFGTGGWGSCWPVKGLVMNHKKLLRLGRERSVRVSIRSCCRSSNQGAATGAALFTSGAEIGNAEGHVVPVPPGSSATRPQAGEGSDGGLCPRA